MKDFKTALYRHWDSGGVLLYVGISLSAAARLGQHMRDSGWNDEIAKVGIEYHENRQLAMDAEAVAIRAESPVWNKVHTKRKASASGSVQMDKGYIRILSDLARAAPSAHALFWLFAEKMNRKNLVQISQPEICQVGEMSSATVKRAVALLAKKKLISIRKAGTSNVYQVSPCVVW
jgi:hypothetical protein